MMGPARGVLPPEASGRAASRRPAWDVAGLVALVAWLAFVHASGAGLVDGRGSTLHEFVRQAQRDR